MTQAFLDAAMTPAVRAAQVEMGSARIYQRGETADGADLFTEREAEFVSARDSFYMASVSSAGWPYVQHRGGPPGFLKVLDARTLAFADYRGNRQYLSLGNVRGEDRVCLFLMDYPARRRLKILAHAQALTLDSDPALSEAVCDPSYPARPERIFRLRLQAFDWNCSQHITPRLGMAEIAVAVAPLRERLAALESENAALRARLNTQGE